LKVTAVAHPIQGLVKYHGLRNSRQRIPFHDSVSVCVEALRTTTTVEALRGLRRNEVSVNGRVPDLREGERVEVVLGRLKELAGFLGGFRVVSENSLKAGKGLGFSASGFAALGLAASKALDCELDAVSLSEVVRLGAGSSTRSLAGGFAIWYADKGGRSFAERLRASVDMDFSMVIVPVRSDVKTDEAHAEVLSSCLFRARLRRVGGLVRAMKRAVREGDTAAIGRLAEEDTLNLHAITMTGKSRMVLWEPDTVRVLKEVVRMREEEGVLAWYSMDTGPSVFVNTFKENAGRVAGRFREMGFDKVIVSGVGGKPVLTEKHLF
jgi:phosphomevalonate decarboxylase